MLVVKVAALGGYSTSAPRLGKYLALCPCSGSTRPLRCDYNCQLNSEVPHRNHWTLPRPRGQPAVVNWQFKWGRWKVRFNMIQLSIGPPLSMQWWIAGSQYILIQSYIYFILFHSMASLQSSVWCQRDVSRKARWGRECRSIHFTGWSTNKSLQ